MDDDEREPVTNLDATKPSTQNTSAAVSKLTSNRKSKPITRTRSFNEICYLTDEESASATNLPEFGDSGEVSAATKKSRTRKRKCGGEVGVFIGATSKKQHTAPDVAQPVKIMATTSTQTDIWRSPKQLANTAEPIIGIPISDHIVCRYLV